MRALIRVLAASCVVAVPALSCSSSPWPAGGGPASDAGADTYRIPPAPPRLPGEDRLEVLRLQETAPGYDFADDGAGGFASHAGVHGSSATVTAAGGGVKLTSDRAVAPVARFELGVVTSRVGRSDGSTASNGVLERRADGQELVLTRDHGVEERYLAGPLGLEQSYTLSARPGGGGSLVVDVAFDGLTPRLVPGTTDRVELLDGSGRVRTRYSDLVAVDSSGVALAASMQVHGETVSLVVDDVGAAYPVRIDPLVWTQQGELDPGDGAAGDWFGAAVALSGNLAIVGAPNHVAGGKAEAGAAYVYVLDGATWTLQQELTAGDAATDDSFGTSVALGGGVAVVGAPFHSVGGKAQAGAAYVFTQSGTTWSQTQELTASDDAAEDQFGNAVALSGGTAVVGAPLHAVGGKSEAGAAYVFAQSGTTFAQQQELTAGDDEVFDLFGWSVAVSGTTAVVGAYQHDVGTVTSAGSAYVFAQSGSSWSQQQELTAADGAISDSFGYSVAVNGATAVVGAYQHDVGTALSAGAAYVYVESGTTWGEQQELNASDDAAGDAFGAAVGVFGGTAVVGAYGHAVGANARAGAAYTFTQSGTTWAQAQELTASDGAASDQFGSAVGANGDSVIVGALAHSGAGAAYVFLGAVTGGTECYIGGTVYASGAQDPADPCQSCVPATSTTSFTTSAEGSSCGAGLVCNNGSCVAGCYIADAFFASGAANPGNSCEVCTPSSSTTAWSDVGNGASCSTGNACFETETCQSGVCTGSTPVVCTPSDACHVAGTCNPATGLCSNPAAPNGTACSDGVSCDENDVCTNGTCAGTPYICAPGVCQAASVCSGNAGCSVTDDPAGTACPGDGNPCHLAQCDGAGDCAHPNVPDGTACGAGPTCMGGVCTAVGLDAGSSEGGTMPDGGTTSDAGTSGDAGASDGAAGDGGAKDAAAGDGGAKDAGSKTDGGSTADASSSDGASSEDAGGGSDGAAGDGSARDGAVGETDSGLEAGSADAGDGGESGDGGTNAQTGQSGGCGCKTAGGSREDRPAALLGMAGLAFAIGRRRRRRR